MWKLRNEKWEPKKTSIDIPEDFEQFWQIAREEANSVRLDYRRTVQSEHFIPGFKIETIEISTVGQRKLSGWFAFPSEVKKSPAFLWINPYGRESLLPNEYGTRPGFASLNLNFFGHPSFYQEKYRLERGYFSEGIGSPETFIFRQMIQDCLVGLRVLRAQLEIDEDRIGATGMSQGGGFAIACGAHSPIVKAVCADMPFLGDIRSTLRNSVHRYPLKEVTDYIETTPLGRERVDFTLGYFDTVNHASFCKVPTHVTLGLKDPSCRPASVQQIFDALPGKKELTTLDWGHDWHPSMIQANQKWFEENLG